MTKFKNKIYNFQKYNKIKLKYIDLLLLGQLLTTNFDLFIKKVISTKILNISRNLKLYLFLSFMESTVLNMQPQLIS